MKKFSPSKSAPHGLMIIFILLCILVLRNSTVLADTPSTDGKQLNLNMGYSALALFLQDEQYLTIIRRTKAVLMFEGIDESSKKLIDAISDSSAIALEQLEYLASEKPAIQVEEFPEDSITMTTFDAIRMTTARELLFDSDDFEKNLLISQAKILRVISHLASEVQKQEPNLKRKDWLGKLAGQYEAYYREVFTRLSLAKPAGN